MPPKRILILLIPALLIKLCLFIYAEQKVPDLKIRNDTHGYLESGTSLVTQGVFGRVNADGSHEYQYYRTPGYPLWLGIAHGWLKIPLSGIILLQIFLTILSAAITSLAANKISPGLGRLTFVIMIFDPAITVYSLMLLSETLFLFLMSVFLYLMVIYLKEQTMHTLLLSALTLAMATYVRPISLYLGGLVAFFIFLVLCPSGFKKALGHAILFVLVIHSLLLPWQWRNYQHFHEYSFSYIESGTINSNGLYKSYARHKDPRAQGMSPFPYYANVSARCLTSLLTRPVSLKYFKSEPLKKAGKVLSYPWIGFCLIGFLLGVGKAGRNNCLLFLGLVVLYFAVTSVVGVMWIADARFRVPMLPYIAILAAHGWASVKGAMPD